jgi:hypothetical protein
MRKDRSRPALAALDIRLKLRTAGRFWPLAITQAPRLVLLTPHYQQIL